MLKATEPVGTPPYCPETVAVRFTDWPSVEGVAEDFKVTEELA